MARKTTKKKSTKRDPERIERNKRIAIGTALVIGATAVFVGGALGVGELDRKASELIVPGSITVNVNWPTNSRGEIWMPTLEQSHIEQLLSHSVRGGSALSLAPLQEAGLALMNTGWVDDVPDVRWTSKGVIDVHAKWRTPAAAIRIGTREIIIDWNRRVLPLDYAIGESWQYYFINADARLPSVGDQWVGTDLQDGLALLQRLQRENLLEQVAGFDLGKGADSGTLVIITKRDGKIVWGAGPGRERPGEQPAGVKIDRLKSLFSRTGLIDGGAELVEIHGADILFERREK